MRGSRRAAAALLSLVAVVGLGRGAGVADAAPEGVVLTPIDNPLVALPPAAGASLIRYPSTSVTGEPITLTGSLLTPKKRPPAGGWPLAVWGHMTTGGADACAPSTAAAGSSALTDMTSGDLIVSGLLKRGFAVVRPDYEGIGSPGPHPYLIGSSLARSMVDAAKGAVAADPRIGRDVVVAGHSEGAVAALFAAAEPARDWGDLRLRAAAAVTPPTRMGDIVDGVAEVPVKAGSATGELVGLAALLISGGKTVDRAFARTIDHGGLSVRAQRLMPQVETRCYRDLSSERSFGALAPSELLGLRGTAAKAGLAAIARRNDVAGLQMPAGLPVRMDAGLVDEVAPAPFVSGLADLYRRRGTAVTFATHPAGHSTVPRAPQAAAEVSTWLARKVHSTG
ncbi:MAG: lipase family protein [Gordonia sp. (in: high G+C Gram-positive bacteria)]|uniref:lipase family protein n=1 Tax=Gordonia sp. (in: high G+C Gram-positive bacteria) TaxID=84139 RepID=UPI0039E5F5E8